MDMKTIRDYTKKLTRWYDNRVCKILPELLTDLETIINMIKDNENSFYFSCKDCYKQLEVFKTLEIYSNKIIPLNCFKNVYEDDYTLFNFHADLHTTIYTVYYDLYDYKDIVKTYDKSIRSLYKKIKKELNELEKTYKGKLALNSNVIKEKKEVKRDLEKNLADSKNLIVKYTV